MSRSDAALEHKLSALFHSSPPHNTALHLTPYTPLDDPPRFCPSAGTLHLDTLLPLDLRTHLPLMEGQMTTGRSHMRSMATITPMGLQRMEDPLVTVGAHHPHLDMRHRAMAVGMEHLLHLITHPQAVSRCMCPSPTTNPGLKPMVVEPFALRVWRHYAAAVSRI